MPENPSGPPAPELTEFLDHLRVERKLSPNTVVAYGSDLKPYAAFLKKRGLAFDAVTPPVLTDFLWERRERLKAASLARLGESLRQFHRFLKSEGRSAQDPTENLSAPKTPSACPRCWASTKWAGCCPTRRLRRPARFGLKPCWRCCTPRGCG